MKTKLLRKVRNRYSITRCDKPSNIEGSTLHDIAKEIGCPFYFIEDTHDYGSHWVNNKQTRLAKTMSAAMGKLIEKVHNDYFCKIKYKEEVTRKVWHTTK